MVGHQCADIIFDAMGQRIDSRFCSEILRHGLSHLRIDDRHFRNDNFTHDNKFDPPLGIGQHRVGICLAAHSQTLFLTASPLTLRKSSCLPDVFPLAGMLPVILAVETASGVPKA
jgi:hypothetical protein